MLYQIEVDGRRYVIDKGDWDGHIDVLIESPASGDGAVPEAVAAHAEQLARTEGFTAPTTITVSIFQPQRVGYRGGNTPYPVTIHLDSWQLKEQP